MTKLTKLFLALAIALPVTTAHAAGANTGSAAAHPAIKMSLSPAERGAAVAQFVRQWGAYVEGVYGLDVGSWAQRMVPQFSRGDAVNIQRALARGTYEGAMAEFNGTGAKLSDEQAITLLAKSSSGSMQPTLLGDLDNDLVFTPITPCRIADTRNMAAGPIAANTSRTFDTWGWGSYAPWGGSATDCGMLNQPSAVVVNVTAVFPSIAGYATAYSGALASPPFVSTVNYKAGDIANNLAVVTVNPGGSPDYKIYTYAQSHFTVDVVGYYDTPHATALDCVDVPGTATPLPQGFTTVVGGTCGAGYKQVALACDTSNFNTILAGQRSATRQCWFNNPTVTAYSGTATTTCCRTPGR